MQYISDETHGLERKLKSLFRWVWRGTDQTGFPAIGRREVPRRTEVADLTPMDRLMLWAICSSTGISDQRKEKTYILNDITRSSHKDNSLIRIT